MSKFMSLQGFKKDIHVIEFKISPFYLILTRKVIGSFWSKTEGNRPIKEYFKATQAKFPSMSPTSSCFHKAYI